LDFQGLKPERITGINEGGGDVIGVQMVGPDEPPKAKGSEVEPVNALALPGVGQ
jgi:hypothetical protein